MPSPTQTRFLIPLLPLLLVSGAAPPPPINASPKYARAASTPGGQHPGGQHQDTVCRTAPHGPTPAPILCAVQYLRPQQCRRRVCRCGQHPVWPAPPWRTHYSEIDRIEMTTLQPSGRLPQGSLVPDRTGFSPSVFRFFAEFPQRKPNYLGNFHPFRCKQGTYPKSRAA